MKKGLMGMVPSCNNSSIKQIKATRIQSGKAFALSKDHKPNQLMSKRELRMLEKFMQTSKGYLSFGGLIKFR
jgi:hypothetical protein